MDINLTKLRQNEGELVQIDEKVEIEQIEYHQDELQVKEPLTVTGGAIFTSDDSIHLSLDFSTTVIQHCRRCLEPVEAHLNRHEEIEFQLGLDAEVDSEGEVSIYRYKETDDKIDLLPYLIRFIKLDIEPYPLCKPDCKGLCPHCGANLNEEEDHECEIEEEETQAKDPRMEKLGELL